ncbi:MAG: permease [Lentisphaeria bacterium]|nr:permease [Lentisphaeria bacterium]
MTYLHNAWDVMLSLAPWLLLGTLAAGLLHVFLPPDLIRRHLGRASTGSVVKAVMLGVPMPLCSCSVIPAALAIRREGASRGAAVGFMISTPQTGVDSILVSASFLGWPFAVFKVVSAFVTGLMGGQFADLATKSIPSPAPVPAAAAAAARESKLRRILDYGIGDLLYMVWRWIVFGVLVSALITTLVPADHFAGSAVGSPLPALLLALLISLPLYVCATSSVPIAAALVQAGFPTGAALVFLMAGPATNIATVGAVYRGFGARVLGVYLAVIIVGSVGLGYVFAFVVPATVASGVYEHAAAGWIAALAALALSALLLWFAVGDTRRWLRRRHERSGVRLLVDGMHCQGCVRKLETAMSAVEGVRGIRADMETGAVDVFGTDLVRAQLDAAVQAAGFAIRR